jgi:hypothetical protein
MRARTYITWLTSAFLAMSAGCVRPATEASAPDPTLVRKRLEKTRMTAPLLRYKGWYIDLSPDETRLPYDAYFTWERESDDGKAPSYKGLRWIWNGAYVGTDKEGLSAVMKRLEGLPSGSWVLVYPRHYITRMPMRARWFAQWAPYEGECFWRVVSERDLTVMCSIRDHRGMLHPRCKRAYEEWKAEEGAQEMVDPGRLRK